jgi:hypothetical protein
MSENTRQFAKKNETKEKNPFSCKPDKDFSESASSPFAQVLHLQRTIGNKAVTQLIKSGSLQAKLKISPPNDIYEQEADRVADQVMRMSEPKQSLVNGHSSLVQRETNCPECEEKEDEQIQTKPLAEQLTPLVQRQKTEEEDEEVMPKLMDNRQLQRQEDIPEEEEEEPAQRKEAAGGTSEVTPDIESSINAMKGGGNPLSESTRSFFEPRFGTDFSQVRVHSDSRAANTAQAINAKAFTTGKDIVFNSGQYSPGISAGKRLLAHELTHVLQQREKMQRYTIEDCDPKVNPKQDPKNVEQAHKLAFKMLSDAISKINTNTADPVVYAAASNYFKIRLPATTNRDKKNWSHVKNALNTMKSGANETKYECEPKSSLFHGLCIFGGAVSLINIHLCPSWFDLNMRHRAAYLLHEWGHKWGKGINRFFDTYCWDKSYRSLPSTELIKMPDAYMSFIYELSTGIRNLCI